MVCYGALACTEPGARPSCRFMHLCLPDVERCVFLLDRATNRSSDVESSRMAACLPDADLEPKRRSGGAEGRTGGEKREKRLESASLSGCFPCASLLKLPATFPEAPVPAYYYYVLDCTYT